MLPAGFTPQRVRVQLNAEGNTVDQAFPWSAEEPQENEMFGDERQERRAMAPIPWKR